MIFVNFLSSFSDPIYCTYISIGSITVYRASCCSLCICQHRYDDTNDVHRHCRRPWNHRNSIQSCRKRVFPFWSWITQAEWLMSWLVSLETSKFQDSMWIQEGRKRHLGEIDIFYFIDFQSTGKMTYFES